MGRQGAATVTDVPNDALADSRQDAAAVLGLWVLRRSFVPLLVGGAAFAVWSGEELSAGRYFRLDDPLELLQALFSPLVGVAAAVGVRALTTLLSLASAFPRTRWASSPSPRGFRDGPVKRLLDRYYVTAAYGELRWSWTVRGRAAERLGWSSRALTLINVALWSALGVAVAALALATALVTGDG